MSDSENERPRLLLHVGLPKTATTSLQRNVLMPLHTSQRINFLARCTSESGALHDRLERFRPAIGLPGLTDAEAEAMRPSAEALLDAQRLNVISDERIAGMETVGGRTRYRAIAWLDNLARLFRQADVTVLVTLRSPVDFVLSAYAEDYYWRFYAQGPYDAFPKFVEQLLAAKEGTPAWIVFFYDAYLRAVRRRFRNVKVLLYEDVVHDRAAWYAGLSECLCSNPGEIEQLFSAQPHNVGRRTAAGKRSRHLTVGHLVRKRFRSGAANQTDNRHPLQRIPLLTRTYRKIAPFRLPITARHHRYPDDDVRRQVRQHLAVDADELDRAFGVDPKKLARYGYLLPPDVDRPARETGSKWTLASAMRCRTPKRKR